jgi:hypothetical protein
MNKLFIIAVLLFMSSSSHSFAQKRNVAEENENNKIVTEFYQKLLETKTYQ